MEIECPACGMTHELEADETEEQAQAEHWKAWHAPIVPRLA